MKRRLCFITLLLTINANAATYFFTWADTNTSDVVSNIAVSLAKGSALWGTNVDGTITNRSANGVAIKGSLVATNNTDYIGLLNFPADLGGPFVDIGITSATSNGTKIGYTNRIDGVDLERLYATSDGAGSFTAPTVEYPFGVSSLRSNLVAPTSITAPLTTVNWTNPINAKIEVYIDNSGVTGTAIKKNGATIFTSLVGDVTIGLQSGEFISLTYSIGTPSIKWSPF